MAGEEVAVRECLAASTCRRRHANSPASASGNATPQITLHQKEGPVSTVRAGQFAGSRRAFFPGSGRRSVPGSSAHSRVSYIVCEKRESHAASHAPTLCHTQARVTTSAPSHTLAPCQATLPTPPTCLLQGGEHRASLSFTTPFPSTQRHPQPVSRLHSLSNSTKPAPPARPSTVAPAGRLAPRVLHPRQRGSSFDKIRSIFIFTYLHAASQLSACLATLAKAAAPLPPPSSNEMKGQ